MFQYNYRVTLYPKGMKAPCGVFLSHEHPKNLYIDSFFDYDVEPYEWLKESMKKKIRDFLKYFT
jgi:hypothetical protein